MIKATLRTRILCLHDMLTKDSYKQLKDPFELRCTLFYVCLVKSFGPSVLAHRDRDVIDHVVPLPQLTYPLQGAGLQTS